MMSCAIWISFLFRLPSRSPSILPNASRERGMLFARQLAIGVAVDRPGSSDPAPFENDVASTDLVFRASACFERQGRRADQSFLRSSLARYGLPFRLMRRRRRPSPRRRDWRPSSQTSSVRSPSARSPRSRRSCLRHHFHFGRSTSTTSRGINGKPAGSALAARAHQGC